jgi:tRNA threonylcarbamoyladenosine modification (KEOPS) complex  Pcc1 subunit
MINPSVRLQRLTIISKDVSSAATNTPTLQKTFDNLPSAQSQMELEQQEYGISKLSADLDFEINRIVVGTDSLDSSDFQAVGTSYLIFRVFWKDIPKC